MRSWYLCRVALGLPRPTSTTVKTSIGVVRESKYGLIQACNNGGWLAWRSISFIVYIAQAGVCSWAIHFSCRDGWGRLASHGEMWIILWLWSFCGHLWLSSWLSFFLSRLLSSRHYWWSSSRKEDCLLLARLISSQLISAHLMQVACR